MTKKFHMILILFLIGPGLLSQSLNDNRVLSSYDDTGVSLAKQSQPLEADFPASYFFAKSALGNMDGSNDFQFYNKQFKKATSLRNVGLIITSSGIVFAVTGISLWFAGFYGVGSEETAYLRFTVGLFYSGIILINVGIPIWATGGTKRNNNRKATEKFEGYARLSFGTTYNGVGFTFRF